MKSRSTSMLRRMQGLLCSRGMLVLCLLALWAPVMPAGAQATCQGVSSARCVGGGISMTMPVIEYDEKWKRTWGAIAIDIATDGEPGISGRTIGEFSRRKAKNLALRDCQAAGGDDCQVVLWYADQCAALALPDPVFGKRYGARAGQTKSEAARLALEECGSEDCKLVFIDCTDPVRVR